MLVKRFNTFNILSDFPIRTKFTVYFYNYISYNDILTKIHIFKIAPYGSLLILNYIN